jgi:hypothetical protein
MPSSAASTRGSSTANLAFSDAVCRARLSKGEERVTRSASDETQSLHLVMAGIADEHFPLVLDDVHEVGVDLDRPVERVGFAVAGELYCLLRRLLCAWCEVDGDPAKIATTTITRSLPPPRA